MAPHTRRGKDGRNLGAETHVLRVLNDRGEEFEGFKEFELSRYQRK
jgi:hypothetical protein